MLLGATCLFAWFKGGIGERAGATAVAIAWIGSVATPALFPAGLQPVILLMLDVLLAAALLMIAIRYSSRWLGAAMLLQAFMLAIHAEQLGEDGGMGRITYFIILNAASAAMLLTIIASTVGAWTKRARERRQAAAHPGPPSILPAA